MGPLRAELTISPPPPHSTFALVRFISPLSNPARYASAVTHIVVLPPTRPHSIHELALTPISRGEDEILLALLELCAQTVERLEWRGIGVWGEQVSQVSVHPIRLLTYLPLHHRLGR